MHHDPPARGESSVTGRAPGRRDRVRGHGERDGVTLEEGLVALLAAAAGILLFVGLAQALESRQPRRRRRVVNRPRAEVITSPELGTSVVTELPPRAPYTGPERRRAPRSGSRTRPRAPAPASSAPPDVIEATPAARPAPSPVPLEPSADAPAEAVAIPAMVFDPAVEVVERVLALQQTGQHAEVVEAVVPRLET